MEIAWMKHWEDKHNPKEEKNEIANMNRDDYTVLLEEIKHR